MNTAAAAMNIGFSNSIWQGIHLPVDLATLGSLGCTLYVGANAPHPLRRNESAASTNLPIPNSASLNGLLLFLQAVTFEPGAARQIVTSNGLRFVIGT